VKESVLVGYTVAIRPPDELYQPTFDVGSYHNNESDESLDGTSLWRNGLTDEEIEALDAVSTESPCIRCDRGAFGGDGTANAGTGGRRRCIKKLRANLLLLQARLVFNRTTEEVCNL